MIYPNVILHPATQDAAQSFSYRLSVGTITVIEHGFTTSEDAAWACDKARLLLKPFLRRSRPYNFPERLQQISESEASNVSAPVLSAYLTLCAAFPQTPGVRPLETINTAAQSQPVQSEHQKYQDRFSQLVGKYNELLHQEDCLFWLKTKLTQYANRYSESKNRAAVLRLVEKLSVEASLVELACRSVKDEQNVVETALEVMQPSVDFTAEEMRESLGEVATESAQESKDSWEAVAVTGDSMREKIADGVILDALTRCTEPVPQELSGAVPIL